MGQSSRTGGGFRYYEGFDNERFKNKPGSRITRGLGRGRGNGFGFRGGRGEGRGFCFTSENRLNAFVKTGLISLSREDEIRRLKTESEALRRSQNEIESRLEELEKRNRVAGE
jgi:hypothetical protein